MTVALEWLQIIGGVSSALLAFLTLLSIIATKTNNGKQWVKKVLGILELKDKLENHLNGDEINIRQNELQGQAILSILRNNMRHMCIEVLNRKYVTQNELETLMKAYDAYKGLGGNSFIDELVNKVLSLPIHEDKF